jgi:hypothetical protein
MTSKCLRQLDRDTSMLQLQGLVLHLPILGPTETVRRIHNVSKTQPNVDESPNNM